MSWAVGDLAVCVDRSIVDCGPCIHTGDNAPPLKAIRRVKHVSSDTDCGCSVLVFAGEVEVLASRFRKVLPADPAFIEQMNSLRPKVEA